MKIGCEEGGRAAPAQVYQLCVAWLIYYERSLRGYLPASNRSDIFKGFFQERIGRRSVCNEHT
jgi:hypothetical protein